MERRIRIVGLSFAIAWLAWAAEAVEVALQLESVTSQDCAWRPNHSGPRAQETCVAAISVPAVAVAPAATGSVVDVDALGVTLGVFVSLPGYTLDEFPVAPWSGAIERLDSHTSRYAGPEGSGGWELRLTRFTDQAEFAGQLVRTLSTSRGPTGHTKWTLYFSFASVPNAGAAPCLGEILLLDDDADGEANHRDLWPAPWTLKGNFGTGIDEWGRTIVEFCDAARLTCSRADFRNDEALAKKPLDCRLNRGQCVPAEMFGPVAVSATPPRQCLGHAVITDSDGDAEPDATDRCAGTPAGAFVDGNGCSAPQFCSEQSASTCQRSDFRNDEPLAKKPFDCALTQSAPLACSAATQ